MFSQMQDFVTEQMQAITGQAQQFGADPLALVREGVTFSVDGLKSLKQPVRVAAKSSVQLSAVSHKAFQDLVELQSDVLTTALTEFASGLERAAHAKDVTALVSAQTDAVRASAERLVNDANRAMEIFATAGRDVQQIAVDAYEKVAKPVQPTVAPRKAKAKRARKAKTAVKAEAA